MKLNALYKWQIELDDGTIVDQYDVEGNEKSTKDIDPIMGAWVSYIPKLTILPEHTIIIDKNSGERFVRRFQRGFMKMQQDGFKLKEYIHCCVTNRYRVYIFSAGKILITNKDYELYI